MTRVTLSQKKAALQSEKSNLETLIDRKHAKPEHHARLSEIEAQFKVFEMMGKPVKSQEDEHVS